MATANGSGVMEATSRGPAASSTPSPRFPIVVLDQIHRKFIPRLSGSRAPTVLLIWDVPREALDRL
jgi:hypothetical protein